MESLPYLLVAERSVLPIIGCVVESLEKYADASSITTVVPEADMESFRNGRCGRHRILSEEEVLPEWPLGRIRSLLHAYPDRAGWYLQQFLKLNFGRATNVAHYVVWDADTVMLACPEYLQEGHVLMNSSRQYNRSYFQTYCELFGAPPVLTRSVITQYMLIETRIVHELQAELEQRHKCDWVEAILRVIPGTTISEFSEYETYANYYEWRHPGSIQLEEYKWFRYGAYVFPDADRSLEAIEARFHGYGYVAFERHKSSWLKILGAKALCRMGL